MQKWSFLSERLEMVKTFFLPKNRFWKLKLMIAWKITILQWKVVRLFCRPMRMLRGTFVRLIRTVKKFFLPKDLFLKVKNGVSLKNNYFTGKRHMNFQ